MADNPNDSVDTAQGVANPSRRRLLKLLAAGGAVSAVTLLPGKWSSPSIKTGVLPAHAQVTPGRYEVRCNPEWDTGPGEGEVIWFLSATAWDTGSNTALVSVSLTATIAGSQVNYQSTATTNAQGVANFQINVPDNEFVTSATVTFTSQGVYGSDSCTIRLETPE